ncbi:Predicted amino acid racemase [Seinonella peptonophila]|uniref:Predicted amino acid racemase n=1 Tax=Seinonella peptonophila TaxID=112248 RepID=A0A1M4Z959_9BACL|nr:alanine racemase [Seinonella peptonophila]SHF14534.1 Predicted amino acid racemase [Seinonella peptonophila]
MFTDVIKRRNPSLLKASVMLHQSGQIPPNTYVVDLDALTHNIQKLSLTAKEHDFQLYFMSKQLGRNDFIGRWISQHGIDQAVAVDYDEARILAKSGVKIGHLGHLVQPGKNEWGHILKQIQPQVVTVFSKERAAQLSAKAIQHGLVQDVLLRVVQPNDEYYQGQAGGFTLEELSKVIPELNKLSGIRVVGVTTFPVLKLNETQTEYLFTSNLETLLAARDLLQSFGMNVTQLNGPSATCCHTIPMLKQQGITHGEPGHALTGTTPLHAALDLDELPAMVYVTEVSHFYDDHVYVIGGGFYPRSHMKGAFVARHPDQILHHYHRVTEDYRGDHIDYYGELERKEDTAIGDTVVYAFRTQIFVTRAHVAYIRHIDQKPELVYLQRRGT